MSSDLNSNQHQEDGNDNTSGGDESSQMDDFSSVDFSMTEFNIKDSQGPALEKNISTEAEMEADDRRDNDGGNSKSALEQTDKGQNKRECHGDGMTCTECGKTFSHTFYFGTHIMSHMAEKDYSPVGQCGMCGLVFADVTIYQAHMNSLQSRLDEMAKAEQREVNEGKKQNASHKVEKRHIGENDTKIHQQKQKQIVHPIEDKTTKSKIQQNVSAKKTTHNDNPSDKVDTISEESREDSLKRPASPSSPTADTNEDGSLPQKRVRRAPIKYECLPEVKKIRTSGKRKLLSPMSMPSESSFSPDYDPEVERYLQSLKDMGLTVDPDAFGVKGGGSSKRGRGGGWSGEREGITGSGSDKDSSFGRGGLTQKFVGRGGKVGPGFNMREGGGGGRVGNFDPAKKTVGRVMNEDGWRNHALQRPPVSHAAKVGAGFDVPKRDVPPIARRHTWNDSVPPQKHTPVFSPPHSNYSGFSSGEHSFSAYGHGRDHPFQPFVGKGQFPVRRMTREEEDEEIVSLMTAELEVMPKSGKQTRGERLKQRQERLGQNGGREPVEISEGKRKGIQYNPPKEEKAKRGRGGKGRKILSVYGGVPYSSGFRGNDKSAESSDSSSYGFSLKQGQFDIKNKDEEDDDDDVQVIDFEESSNSSSSSLTHHSKPFPVITSVTGARRPITSKSTNQSKAESSVGKVTNLEGNMEELRKEARKKVEDMLTSPEVIFKNFHNTEKAAGDDGEKEKPYPAVVPIPSSLKYCGEDAQEKDAEDDWKVEERNSDDNDDDNVKESEEVGEDETEEVENETKDAEDDESREEKEDVKARRVDDKQKKEERDEDIQEGDDIAGWTVSISNLSDSEEEGEEEGDGKDSKAGKAQRKQDELVKGEKKKKELVEGGEEKAVSEGGMVKDGLDGEKEDVELGRPKGKEDSSEVVENEDESQDEKDLKDVENEEVEEMERKEKKAEAVDERKKIDEMDDEPCEKIDECADGNKNEEESSVECKEDVNRGEEVGDEDGQKSEDDKGGKEDEDEREIEFGGDEGGAMKNTEDSDMGNHESEGCEMGNEESEMRNNQNDDSEKGNEDDVVSNKEDVEMGNAENEDSEIGNTKNEDGVMRNSEDSGIENTENEDSEIRNNENGVDVVKNRQNSENEEGDDLKSSEIEDVENEHTEKQGQ